MERKLFLIILLTLKLAQSFGQYYQVESFQDEYKEIEKYTSLLIEKEGFRSWDKRFDLDFVFPFFELHYMYINGNYEGIFGFDDEIEYSLDLLAFGYHFDNVIDTINIKSDVRYNLTEINGKKCLVVQYTKNRLISDPSIEEFDTYVNFQYWFFENGTIELRFGKANLNNTPVYIPGDGFYLQTNQGPIPFGPFLGLTHPLNAQVIVNYNDLDSLHNFEIIDNWENGSVNWWPPEGWVIRFTNLLVSTENNSMLDQVSVFPNPAIDKLFVKCESPLQSAEVFNLNGEQHIITLDKEMNEADISALQPGIWFLRLSDGNKIWNTKFIKI